jgi:rRNA biogenesis protein RRP5
MFEGILSTYPKRLDIWNQLLDLEIQQKDKDIIRGLFERLAKTKGIKEKGALAWFKRWNKWEEIEGDPETQKRVREKAEGWVSSRVAAKGE